MSDDTVIELLRDRINGSIESILWHTQRDRVAYGLAFVANQSKNQIYIDTLVVDLEDETVRIHGDNSMWLPGDRDNIDPIIRSIARSANSIHSGGFDDDGLRFSSGPDPETIETTTLDDDYNPGKDWKAQEGPEQMQELRSKFVAAGIEPADRFIRLKFGRKDPWGSKRRMRSPDEIAGNYGIEVNPSDRLVLLDVDDMDQAPLDAIPRTLTVESPHGGRHYYFAVEDWDLETWGSRFSTDNPHPSYGEVRATDGYVVGPGSELTDCKHGCCTDDDPGIYQIIDDQPIESVTTAEFSSWIKPFRGGSA